MTKLSIVPSPSLRHKPKNVKFTGDAVASILRAFRERGCFSLEYREIRPSAVFGLRRKNVLCGAGYAWTPDLGSFLKLLEVGFSPYLSFIPILSVLLMFRLNEAVRGRWISPKTWDRIDIIFERKLEQPVTAPRLFGLF